MNASEFIEKASSNKALLFIILLSILFIIYIASQINIQTTNCDNIRSDRLNNKNNKYNKFYSFDDMKNRGIFIDDIKYDGNETMKYNYKLKDFYIKSAYNACCSGNFKNDYVDICALRNAMSYGCRLLDFQVYQLNGEPIVGASSVDSNLYKEMYNDIRLNDVMAQVKNIAYSSGYFDNSNVISNNLQTCPLFLSLRLYFGNNNDTAYNNKSHDENCKAFYNNIYDILVNTFGKDKFNATKYIRTYGNDYFNKNRDNIIPNVPMVETKNKIFLFVYLNDINTSLAKETKLNKLVDLYAEMDGLYAVRYENVINEDSDFGGLSMLNVSKERLVYCMPNYQIRNMNYDFSKAVTQGIQFMGMNFQNDDSYLRYYNDFFINGYNAGSSSSQGDITSVFIKKPSQMIHYDIPYTNNDNEN